MKFKKQNISQEFCLPFGKYRTISRKILHTDPASLSWPPPSCLPRCGPHHVLPYYGSHHSLPGHGFSDPHAVTSSLSRVFYH